MVHAVTYIGTDLCNVKTDQVRFELAYGMFHDTTSYDSRPHNFFGGTRIYKDL